MSLVAGILSLQGDPIDPSWIATIRSHLSRREPPHHEYEDDRFYLAKVDIGTFPGSGFFSQPVVAAITGETYYAADIDRRADRDVDLRKLAALPAGDASGLQDCRGSFSYVRYDPDDVDLLVAVDRLGMRAVYFHESPQHLFFSSSLRLFKELSGVPKRLDLRALAEQSTFGIPLADRTPYAGVRNLKGGEFLRARGGRVEVGSYVRWGDIPATRLTREEFQKEAFRLFQEAVAIRSAGDPSPVSFLTGGLDSRAVVGALVSLGKKPFTLNFEYPDLLDGEIAPRLARELGTRHRSWPVSEWRKVSYLTNSVPALLRYAPPNLPARPRAVFSGDGGSVGLGFVYMDEHIVDLMRAGRLDELARYYLEKKRLPRRILRPEVYDALRPLPEQGLREELARAGGREPAKDFHLFLMGNDQRRHVHYMFEDLDLNRVEFLLPFYDGKWLELIGSAPVDWFLLHRFYNDWIRHFPEPVYTIPWQSYPGHVPCPLPQPHSMTQWDLPRLKSFEVSEEAFQGASKSLFGSGFPSPVFRRIPLLAGLLLHGLRLRNLSHFWATYDTFSRYYGESGDKLVWP
jgi:hypothetical protein